MATVYEQIETVIRFFNGKKLSRDSPPYKVAIEWLQHLQRLPMDNGNFNLRKRLVETVCNTFDLMEPELLSMVTGVTLPSQLAGPRTDEAELWKQLPKGAWLDWYAQYTAKTESPLSYHIFSSLCTLGAAVGRRVWKNKGFFNIYLNYPVILIGPPAKVAKTSACEIAKWLIHENVLCPIMADKFTPEALMMALAESGGHHFIFAPEMSFLFGKQKYMEGMTQTFLRLLDSPAEIAVRTVGRGPETLTGLALTVLGASTMSLLTGSTPEQITQSGFVSRFLLVIENDTDREFFEPMKGSKELEGKIMATLQRMKAYQGEVIYSPAATLWAQEEYTSFKRRVRSINEEALAEAISRYAIHLERTAMLIHLAECASLTVCDKCFQVAKILLGHLEKRMPQIIQAINKTEQVQESDKLLSLLHRMGGAAQHSNLLRRSNMGAAAFKSHMNTLIEQQRVRADKQGMIQFYILEGGGE